MTLPIIFLWDNFGPMHADRVEAVARRLGTKRKVIGIEIFANSDTYDWISEGGALFEKRTLFQATEKPGFLQRLLVIGKALLRVGRGNYFLCHYERPEVLWVAWMLRLTGSRVYMMGNSKFDDYTRQIWREVLKILFLLPYQGALAGSSRSKDYLRFLGVRKNSVLPAYNTVSVDRWRRNAAVTTPPAPDTHAHRPFVCIARLVPKKNISVLIEAYALYRTSAEHPRNLHLCGSGELEADLRRQAAGLGLEGKVRFHGFLQTQAVAKVLAGSLALVLPSIEEQFGNVVVEAQACGVPVIVSENCGVRDQHVRSGVNGFVIEPDNPQGLAFYMGLLCKDARLWACMARAAWMGAHKGDVARFAEAVEMQLQAGLQ